MGWGGRGGQEQETYPSIFTLSHVLSLAFSLPLPTADHKTIVPPPGHKNPRRCPDLEVVKERVQHVLGTDSLGDVAERVHGCTANGLLVRLKHLQQLEADTHPLPSAHVLRAAVGDSPHEVDAVLLHLFVAKEITK